MLCRPRLSSRLRSLPTLRRFLTARLKLSLVAGMVTHWVKAGFQSGTGCRICTLTQTSQGVVEGLFERVPLVHW